MEPNETRREKYCPRCNGYGRVPRLFFQGLKTCPDCGGTGVVIVTALDAANEALADLSDDELATFARLMAGDSA